MVLLQWKWIKICNRRFLGGCNQRYTECNRGKYTPSAKQHRQIPAKQAMHPVDELPLSGCCWLTTRLVSRKEKILFWMGKKRTQWQFGAEVEAGSLAVHKAAAADSLAEGILGAEVGSNLLDTLVEVPIRRGQWLFHVVLNKTCYLWRRVVTSLGWS